MKNNLKQLFTPFSINGCEVKNRSVARTGQATVALNNNHFLTKEALEFYVRQAQNGVGMIIAGTQGLTSTPFKSSMKNYSPIKVPSNYLNKLQKMVDRVHNVGTKIFADISEGYNSALPKLILERRVKVNPIIGKHYFKNTKTVNPEILQEQQLLEHFVVSAKEARITGYDGIQINLPALKHKDDFIPTTNLVKGLMAQFKIASKIIKSIKETCGNGFPVTLNINLSYSLINYFESQLTDELFFEPILSYDDFLESFRTLEKAGYDGFNLTQETENSNWYIDSINRADFNRVSQSIKKWVNVPVIIGAYKSNTEQAEITLKSNAADAVEIEDAINVEKRISEARPGNIDDSFVPSYFWIA